MLALSNCGLWTKISFWSPSYLKQDLLCYPTRLVNQWLSHSGSSPLRLYFNHGMSRGHLKTYVELVLLEHYAQCQFLELSVSASTALGMQNFINLPAGSLSALESLVLEDLDEADFISLDDDEDISFPITAFQLSSRLRKLTTNFLEFTHHLTTNGTVFHPYVLPWAQLTHLLITEFVQIEIFVAALAQCIDIQFLRVSLRVLSDEHFINATLPGPPVNVILPNLKALFVTFDGGSSFPPEMDIFSFPALVDVHIRRYQDNAKEKDHFSWERSPHIRRQLNHVQQLILTGHVGSTEQVMTLLGGMPALVELSLDIFADYQMLLPGLFPYKATSCIQYVQSLEIHLQHGQLNFPGGPPDGILQEIQGSFPHLQMRHIPDISLQPCFFRFRDLIESTHHQSHLNTLRVSVLQGPTCDKFLHELHTQFLSSGLQTYFKSKDDSSRGCSDQDLIKNKLTSYTLH